MKQNEEKSRIRIKVKFFSLLREEFGPERMVGLEKGARIAELAELLGLLKRIEEGDVFIAKNFESAEVNEPLEDGDEVAFFPPVSGG
ncbi:MAG: MoaD/ThiS family protein [Candidatus Thermoplasmatota archaeon]|nr:MoaD/ThiS family protein [Candidatus Thermoplasmatota archaeon]